MYRHFDLPFEADDFSTAEQRKAEHCDRGHILDPDDWGVCRACTEELKVSTAAAQARMLRLRFDRERALRELGDEDRRAAA